MLKSFIRSAPDLLQHGRHVLDVVESGHRQALELLAEVVPDPDDQGSFSVTRFLE